MKKELIRKLRHMAGMGRFISLAIYGAFDYAALTPLMKTKRLEQAIDRLDDREVVTLVKRFQQLLNKPLSVMGGGTVLHYAAYRNILSEILLLKPNVNAVDNLGRNALFFVKTSDNAEKLISAGADVNKQDRHSKTPLFSAISIRNTDLVKTFIKHHADVNHVSMVDDTPVMLALQYGDEDIIGILLESGADPEKSGSDEVTCAVDRAKEIQSGTHLVCYPLEFTLKNANPQKCARMIFDHVARHKEQKLKDMIDQSASNLTEEQIKKLKEINLPQIKKPQRTIKF